MKLNKGKQPPAEFDWVGGSILFVLVVAAL
jgi:hypothetical protein